jgi:hypothetical protein
MYSGCNDLKGRVAPFGNQRINACLPAPRRLSQATASFIAGYRLGIHHVHLITCPYNVGFCAAQRNTRFYTKTARYSTLLRRYLCPAYSLSSTITIRLRRPCPFQA